MNDLRKAAEMALAKLDHLWEIAVDERMGTDVLPEIKALRQALAQPEQEPVAIVNEGMGGIEWLIKPLPDDTSLYTAPPSIEAAVLAEREACLKEIAIELDEWKYRTNANIALNNVYAAIQARSEK